MYKINDIVYFRGQKGKIVDRGNNILFILLDGGGSHIIKYNINYIERREERENEILRKHKERKNEILRKRKERQLEYIRRIKRKIWYQIYKENFNHIHSIKYSDNFTKFINDNKHQPYKFRSKKYNRLKQKIHKQILDDQFKHFRKNIREKISKIYIEDGPLNERRLKETYELEKTYGLSHEEAELLFRMRNELLLMSVEELEELKSDITKDEGPEFGELILDGIIIQKKTQK